jgi:hypothetical protein
MTSMIDRRTFLASGIAALPPPTSAAPSGRSALIASLHGQLATLWREQERALARVDAPR